MAFQIESSSGIPITRQLAAQIRARCAAGILLPGQRMPSVRELASELAINQNTVLRVYERLTAEGLLQKKHGAGTFVGDRLPAGGARQEMLAIEQDVDRLALRARLMGLTLRQLHQHIDQGWKRAEKQAEKPLEQEKAL